MIDPKSLATYAQGGLIGLAAGAMTHKNKEKFDDDDISAGLVGGTLVIMIIMMIGLIIMYILCIVASYKLTEQKILHMVLTILLGTFWTVVLWIHFGLRDYRIVKA